MQLKVGNIYKVRMGGVVQIEYNTDDHSLE